MARGRASFHTWVVKRSPQSCGGKFGRRVETVGRRNSWSVDQENPARLKAVALLPWEGAGFISPDSGIDKPRMLPGLSALLNILKCLWLPDEHEEVEHIIFRCSRYLVNKEVLGRKLGRPPESEDIVPILYSDVQLGVIESTVLRGTLKRKDDTERGMFLKMITDIFKDKEEDEQSAGKAAGVSEQEDPGGGRNKSRKRRARRHVPGG